MSTTSKGPALRLWQWWQSEGEEKETTGDTGDYDDRSRYYESLSLCVWQPSLQPKGGRVTDHGYYHRSTGTRRRARTTAMVATMQDRLQERFPTMRPTTSLDYVIRQTDTLQELRLKLFRFFSHGSSVGTTTRNMMTTRVAEAATTTTAMSLQRLQQPIVQIQNLLPQPIQTHHLPLHSLQLTTPWTWSTHYSTTALTTSQWLEQE